MGSKLKSLEVVMHHAWLLSALLMIFFLFLHVKIVSGDSMLPAYHPGDIVIINRTGSLYPGDKALYYGRSFLTDEPILVMHRVYYAGEYIVIAKGDNNAEYDDPIWAESIVGKVAVHIPTGKFFH